MTFDTKLTMALAGCSGSCSANRWHTLSVALPCFRATNPKTLQETSLGQRSQYSARQAAGVQAGFLFLTEATSEQYRLHGRLRCTKHQLRDLSTSPWELL